MSDDSARKNLSGRAGLSILKPYLGLLQGQYGQLVLMILLMIFATVISLSIPLFAGRFVDALSEGLPGATRRKLVLGLAVLLLLQLAGSFFYAVISAKVGLRTVTRLRRRLFSHLLELPSLYYTHQKAGDLSSRVTSDVGSIQYLLTNGLVTFLRAAATLIGAIALMFTLNPRLTLVVLALVPATIFLVQIFGRQLQKLSRTMQQELGLISSHVQEIAGAIRIIKVFNNQAYQRERFEGRLSNFRGAGVRRAWHSAALESGAQILLWVCLIAVVVYGFYLSSRGETTYGELVAFLLLAFRVAIPLGSMTNLYSSAQGAVAAATRLDEIFTQPAESPTSFLAVDNRDRQEAAGTRRLHPRRQGEGGTISLEQVRFGYADDVPPIIADLSLTIPAGQKVAVVGPSGAGKTTLTGLILGLFVPQAGRLTFDGRPYDTFELADLRRNMAFVSQEPVLFDVSIAENIRFGRAGVGNEQLREAARQAQALTFIEKLPEGFATLVGDRGVRLSGGERQRIALARAFLHDPSLLVLDEPTSSLDAASEAAVRMALHELMVGRTTIVIAHRLSLVRDLDRILVLNEGEVVEDGTHQELLDAEGLYGHLHRLYQGEMVK